MTKLGNRIKELREERRMSQQDLADACGWNLWFADRIENHDEEYVVGRRVGDLLKLAAAFDADPVNLFHAALDDARNGLAADIERGKNISVVIRPRPDA